MEKIIFLSLLLVSKIGVCVAQTTTYYPSLSVSVAQTAVHRIHYETLQSFWPYIIENQYIHLYRQGKEVALEIHSKNDSYFVSGDYLLFFGKPNDGTTDSSLYASAQAQANPVRPIAGRLGHDEPGWRRHGCPHRAGAGRWRWPGR